MGVAAHRGELAVAAAKEPRPHVRAKPDDLVTLVVCDQCKARWRADTWDARGACPSCSNPTGTDHDFKRDEA